MPDTHQNTKSVNFMQEGNSFHCLYCHKDIPKTEDDYRLQHIQTHEGEKPTMCGRVNNKPCQFSPSPLDWKEEFDKRFVTLGYEGVKVVKPKNDEADGVSLWQDYPIKLFIESLLLQTRAEERREVRERIEKLIRSRKLISNEEWNSTIDYILSLLSPLKDKK